MRTRNADLLRGRKEKAAQTVKRVGEAQYERAKIIDALIDAVYTLKPSAIRNAWNYSHLYPF